MKSLKYFLLFLFLTVFFSFATPIIFVGVLLAGLALMHIIPGFEEIAQSCINSILQFLAIFGNGYPISGILTIALTCGFVGGIFQVGTGYRYRHL
ncbi:MAG: hypothetical protein SAJ12_06960 [Jaaginema sp. PMC 1079.18]|nr:hypothetical protein [Jaaginema sp. PMC 1080.18]MEC4850735.1 hypothetical protein [Jaaginema sp. PMC 1079.18]MEC4865277.1 hypothetical protein [Jaaginema sp. PMC 1078.18]